ncbi:endonuclease [Candidatus Woesearchaeota archaeon]|nr:MAG: endonuclease [Candidatus Woesearchaeota archaeon]
MWKEIYGYEGLYKVSKTGIVKSIPGGKYRKTSEVELKFDEGKYGHRRVTLSKNSITKRFLVHQLVAKAFIDNPERKDFVNHLDFNPRNNNVDNLEWCTHAENCAHAHAAGKLDEAVKTAGRANRGLTFEQAEEIRTIKLTNPKIFQRELAEQFNTTTKVIHGILTGKTYNYK